MTSGATNAEPRYAGVFLLDLPYQADRMYDYFIPQDLRDSAVPGAFVVVPFGGGNRRRTGIITEIREKSDVKRAKPLLSVGDASSALSREQLELCFYMKRLTLCTLGDAVKSVAPPSIGIGKKNITYSPTGKPTEPDGGELSHGELIILEHIRDAGSIREENLVSAHGAQTLEYLRSLEAGGYISAVSGLSTVGFRKKKFYSLAVNGDETAAILAGEKVRAMKRKLNLPSQIAIIKALLEYGELAENELIERAEGSTPRQLATMVSNGLICAEERDDFGDLSDKTPKSLPPLIPNEEQKAALETLSALTEDGKPHAALLYGVTGSGKTTVILGMIDKVTSSGRGVIVLLPEIALTPQMLGVFRSRYGPRVAVMHSGLSAGERREAYLRVRDGLSDIVVGTRSAVFAPVKDLGMIVIDEEQEHTYKSDMSPKYHARDIARKRCADSSALMLLSSATPSVESFKKAQDGIYTLVRLRSRYGSAGLPRVTIADMRQEAHGGNVSPLGKVLSEELLRVNAAGEQSILFLNRRGYNTFVSCVDCGEAVRCPSCSVAMTYHTKKGSYEAGELVCHWCGRRMKMPEKCPSCGSKHLIRCGFGTQKVEQELSVLMPDARVLRMDADTTCAKLSYENLLTEFRERGDVLLGTQMVTKGHDFPRVTLVGVLLADMSLYLDDYRANERTFSLLTQVIGRAGRADRPGHAIIQTNNPDSDVIKLACAQDYDTFYEHEIALRKLLTFPPFCDIVLLTVSHGDEHELLEAVTQLKAEIDKLLAGAYADVPNIMFGPFEAPVYKVDGKYRMRFVVKCRLNNRSRGLFSEILRTFPTGAKKPVLSVDLNPTNL